MSRRPKRRPRGPHQRNQLWIAPMTGAVLAILLAAAALAADHWIGWQSPPLPIFAGEPDTARALLSTIGGAVATLLALIFTVIAVAIQLAVGHYTPRALTILLSDRPTHFTIGVFVGTFTYVLTVLLALRVPSDGEVAAGLSLTFAYVLAVITIATFAVYSNHIIHSVRATSLIHRIAQQTRIAIENLHPTLDAPAPAALPRGAPAQVISAPHPGVLVDLDERKLLPLAQDRDLIFVIAVPVGGFVPEGAPLVEVHGGRCDPDALTKAIRLEPERSMRLDAGFGLRQLMDIAARALSPGINDPATAIQVLDELGDLLRRIGQRHLDRIAWTAADGGVRIILNCESWESTLILTLEDMRRLGKDSLPVMRRLAAVLEDLASAVPEDRRPPLEAQLDFIRQQAEELDFPKDRRDARTPDVRGSGM